MSRFENLRAARERERQDKFAAPYRFGIIPDTSAVRNIEAQKEQLLKEEKDFVDRMDQSLRKAIQTRPSKPSRKAK